LRTFEPFASLPELMNVKRRQSNSIFRGASWRWDGRAHLAIGGASGHQHPEPRRGFPFSDVIPLTTLRNFFSSSVCVSLAAMAVSLLFDAVLSLVAIRGDR
jgi:hypothetical protein